MNTTKLLQWILAVLATAVWIVLLYDAGSKYGFKPILVGLIISIPIVAVKIYRMDPLEMHQ